ncbi:hypothetical protein MTP99_008825 [Tenebrio molitor]|jgi:hypothetical protein|nr:hypothetical protein MTP99_008825 [Tenebrio molitor]
MRRRVRRCDKLGVESGVEGVPAAISGWRVSVAVCIHPHPPHGGHTNEVKKKKSSHHISMVTSWPVVPQHTLLCIDL